MKHADQFLTISNLLTCMRLALIPVLLYAITKHAWLPAIVIFSVAALSDVLDGFLARLWNEQTILGTYLDPLVDKILIISCYVTMRQMPLFSSLIPHWFVILVIIKELIMVIGASYLGLMINAVSVKPTIMGKAAMVCQTVFIASLLFGAYFHQVGAWIGLLLLITIITVFFAAAQYSLLGLRGLILCVFG